MSKILNSGFWRAKILKSAKILNLGFWKAKILKSAKSCPQILVLVALEAFFFHNTPFLSTK